MTVDRVADFSDTDRDEIRLLSLAVYPPEQFENWTGQRLEWSSPQWCVRLRRDDGSLASFIGIYLRVAECDGRRVLIGGIGNVKTHPEARGQGLAAGGIHCALEFMRRHPAVEFALLVCEPQLLPYYARLGWRQFTGKLLVRQHGTACEYTFSRVMTHAIESKAPVAGTIDLCGPPW